jgi:hypothetical protein
MIASICISNYEELFEVINNFFFILFKLQLVIGVPMGQLICLMNV